MTRYLTNPKVITALVVLAVVFLISVAGGALGQAFGFGFLGAPMAAIQLPAEPAWPDPIFGVFTITNTMVTTWVTIIVLLVLSFFATRRITEVPRGAQNFVEIIFDFFLNLCEQVAGRERARRFFPLVMTIFLFIVTANWLGILPGLDRKSVV